MKGNRILYPCMTVTQPLKPSSEHPHDFLITIPPPSPCCPAITTSCCLPIPHFLYNSIPISKPNTTSCPLHVDPFPTPFINSCRSPHNSHHKPWTIPCRLQFPSFYKHSPRSLPWQIPSRPIALLFEAPFPTRLSFTRPHTPFLLQTLPLSHFHLRALCFPYQLYRPYPPAKA